MINNYDRSEVIDPLTVRFFFKEPSPSFLQGTSVIRSSLVSPVTLAFPFEALGDATKIAGSGSFVVASETLGRELTLTARKDYNWGPAKLAHQGHDTAIIASSAALTDAPAAFGAQHIERLRQVGPDDLEIVDVINGAAFFNGANRLILSLGEPTPPAKSLRG
ncbi:hypothetical protein [Microvirga sp. 2TAF3]|uniref:hypothetical protein n=1 Tax=Microvirga sp. 2TAF3 TaxID=3233014 RepID=UPI003F9D711B